MHANKQPHCNQLCQVEMGQVAIASPIKRKLERNWGTLGQCCQTTSLECASSASTDALFSLLLPYVHHRQKNVRGRGSRYWHFCPGHIWQNCFQGDWTCIAKKISQKNWNSKGKGLNLRRDRPSREAVAFRASHIRLQWNLDMYV